MLALEYHAAFDPMPRVAYDKEIADGVLVRDVPRANRRKQKRAKLGSKGLTETDDREEADKIWRERGWHRWGRG